MSFPFFRSNRPRHGRSIRPVGCLRAILWVILIACAGSGPILMGQTEGVDTDEPTVTRKEAELLARVAATAATNINAAVALLPVEDPEKMTAALEFALANLYFQSQQFETAVAAYRRALEQLPRFRRARMNLGRVYLLQDKSSEAVTVFGELVKLRQADADTFMLYGHALTLEGRPVSAENAYRQALLLEPNDIEALLGLVRSLMQQERYREGVNLLKELLEREPDRREFWSLAASAWLALEEHQKALTTLETARRLGAIDSRMLTTLGDLYLNAGQPDDAVAVFRLALDEGEPPVERLLRAAEAFILAGELDHGGEMIGRAEALETSALDRWTPKQRIQLLRLKGKRAWLQGESESAIETYSRILKLDPLDGETLIMLGDLHRRNEALEEAVMSYERAARIAGHEVQALIRQAQVEVERERYTAAVDLLETAQAFKDQPHVGRYLEQIRRLATP